MSELVEHRDQVYFAEDASIRPIADALLHLAADDELRAGIGARLAACGAACWSWGPIADQTCRYYQQVLTRRADDHVRAERRDNPR